MADEKDVPLRAADIPQGAVPDAPGADPPAAAEVANAAAVQADRETERAGTPAEKRIIKLNIKIPIEFGVDPKNVNELGNKIARAADGEYLETLGVAIYTLIAGDDDLAEIFYRMFAVNNFEPLDRIEAMRQSRGQA